eukprot:597242-Prorocentrum_minimum.AAC.4
MQHTEAVPAWYTQSATVAPPAPPPVPGRLARSLHIKRGGAKGLPDTEEFLQKVKETKKAAASRNR